jgi:hypothetical protein
MEKVTEAWCPTCGERCTHGGLRDPYWCESCGFENYYLEDVWVRWGDRGHEMGLYFVCPAGERGGTMTVASSSSIVDPECWTIGPLREEGWPARPKWGT